jgi:hypothetical protein
MFGEAKEAISPEHIFLELEQLGIPPSSLSPTPLSSISIRQFACPMKNF